jgi:hypothetical protein
MSRLQDLIFHPFLIAACPILALLAYNVEQIDSRIALRSLLLCLVFAGVLLLLFRLLSKSCKKAGMLASLTLVFIFSDGRIYTAARLLNESPLPLGRHRLLVPLFGFIQYNINLNAAPAQSGSQDLDPLYAPSDKRTRATHPPPSAMAPATSVRSC